MDEADERPLDVIYSPIQVSSSSASDTQAPHDFTFRFKNLILVVRAGDKILLIVRKGCHQEGDQDESG